MRPLLRFLLLFLPLLFVATHQQHAHAQEVTLETQGFRINRAVERATNEGPYIISRQDCYDDDPNEEDYDRIAETGSRTWIELSVSLRDTSASRHTVEVWASQTADCLDDDERRSDGGACHLVAEPVKANELVKQLRVYPRELILEKGLDDINNPDEYPAAEECDDDEKEEPLILWVLLREGDDIISSVTWEDSSIDTLAPLPPNSLDAGAGDEHLFLEWEIEDTDEDEDTYGFIYYCVPVGTAGDGVGNGGAGGAGTGADCPQDVLIDGQLPGDDATAFKCGEATGRGSRDGQTKKLVNGTYYAVAVAATDLVRNQGRLSPISCSTPQEVITFFEEYKNAGGQGGGGFCGFSGSNKANSLFLLLAACALWLYRRRRTLS
jgi:hypothetical protein